MDEPYHIGFVADETPDTRALYEACLHAGLTTTHDGRTDVVAKYNIGTERHQDQDPEAVVAALERADNGSLYCWTESGMRLRVGFTHATTEREERWGRTSLGFQTSEIDRSHHDETVVAARIQELIDVVEAFVPIVDPEYVWSAVYMEGVVPETVMPDGRPVPDHVDELPWLTIMSERVIEQFGGRGRVLETPAWRVTEFDSGHVMLVLEDHPYEPTDSLADDCEAHLLTG
ncbi:hypothetical protein OB920_20470 [Halobacteria archaeon HArc-gm2]|nr:hypothetical protein [Halobacteria archaeon HArc-gm2]